MAHSLVTEGTEQRRLATFLHRAERHPAVVRRILTFLCAAAGCAISVAWLDPRLALAIARLIPPATLDPNVPDLLAPLVAAVSVAGTVAWIVARKRHRTRFARVALLAATVGPSALGLKYLAKWVFGRPAVQLFLVQPQARAFHWFAGSGNYVGFPSGHMLVATAWVVTVTEFYPRLRPWGRLALLVLALALLLGSYHFLGDLIAGTFLGATVGWITLGLDARWRQAAARRKPSSGARVPS